MFVRHPLFRPLAALVLLLLVDLLLVPGFFHLEIKDGHLYGSLIDIANRAAPLVLAALGMTLVIATRGIDISVGAVVAISGTVAAMLIGGTMVMQNGVPEYVANTPMVWALCAAMGAALLCGAWNGLLVAGLGLQPIVATLILMVWGVAWHSCSRMARSSPSTTSRSSSLAAAICLACRFRSTSSALYSWSPRC